VDLDEVAEELYALRPGEFVAARTEAARRARAAGDRALAGDIGGLARPSTAAWACNALVRDHPDEIAGLVGLGDLLREAQQTLAGDELRQLGTQRSRLLAALTRRARAGAAGRGSPLSDAVADQVEETLRAALADPAAGEALLAGRLTTALSPRGLGFGDRPDLRVVAPPRAGRTPPEPRDRGAGGREERARRAAEERRRAARERWEQELAAAREEAAAAQRGAAEADEAARAAAGWAEEAARRADGLAARAEELAAELDRVREQAGEARAEAARAGRRGGAAGRVARRAAADCDRAVARVAELEQAPPD
jgi:hypothetical protein